METYVAVDKDGTEKICKDKMWRYAFDKDGKPSEAKTWIYYDDPYNDSCEIIIPRGSIEKLIGRKLTWEDEPVELQEEYIYCRCGRNIREDATCLVCGEYATKRDCPIELDD